MKQRRNATVFLLPIGDFILVIGVFLLGYWLRHYILSDALLDLFQIPNDFRLGLWHYAISGSVMACIELVMLWAFGVYRAKFGVAQVEELAWIIQSSFMAAIITFAFTFASRQLLFSRFVLLFSFPAASIAVSFWHYLYHRLSRLLALRSGRGIKVVFFGDNHVARELADYMRKNVPAPYSIAGFISSGIDAPPGEDTLSLSFSSFQDMFKWMNKENISELIIADPELSRKDTAALIYLAEQEDIPYKLVADVFDLVNYTTRVTHIGGTIMIESVPPPLSGTSIQLKRMTDLLLAIPMVILLIPLFILISIAIVIDSGFPVFFIQTRLGKEHKKFRLIKFRSMKVGAHKEKENLGFADKTDLLSKSRNDPRITRIGRFIRKLSLDELPQLINVLVGSMSLVGPRPHIPEEVEHYSERHLKKLDVLPGMTGVCQVSGRNNLNYKEMVKLDLYYVDNWSIWMDLSILILTFPAILFRKGAY
ncbi:MAG: sugar transferase [Candidatus Aegiribacteria sp.]|nr:sugar transferase [Candidatus Aegiribacteria sp.]